MSASTPDPPWRGQPSCQRTPADRDQTAFERQEGGGTPRGSGVLLQKQIPNEIQRVLGPGIAHSQRFSRRSMQEPNQGHNGAFRNEVVIRRGGSHGQDESSLSVGGFRGILGLAHGGFRGILGLAHRAGPGASLSKNPLGTRCHRRPKVATPKSISRSKPPLARKCLPIRRVNRNRGDLYQALPSPDLRLGYFPQLQHFRFPVVVVYYSLHPFSLPPRSHSLLDRDIPRNVRMGIVTLQRKILEMEVEETTYLRV